MQSLMTYNNSYMNVYKKLLTSQSQWNTAYHKLTLFWNNKCILLKRIFLKLDRIKTQKLLNQSGFF